MNIRRITSLLGITLAALLSMGQQRNPATYAPDPVGTGGSLQTTPPAQRPAPAAPAAPAPTEVLKGLRRARVFTAVLSADEALSNHVAVIDTPIGNEITLLMGGAGIKVVDSDAADVPTLMVFVECLPIPGAPGLVAYKASVTLVEQVTILRLGKRIRTQTWGGVDVGFAPLDRLNDTLRDKVREGAGVFFKTWHTQNDPAPAK